AGVPPAQHGQDARATIDVKSLLTCVYQPTENSSSTTRNAAKQLAEGLGADYMELNIGAINQDYIAMVAKAIGRKITWETDDIAMQNIQARVRAPGVWMLANI